MQVNKPSTKSATRKWSLLLLVIPIALFGGYQVLRFIDAISLANYRAERIALETQVAVEKNCLLEQGVRGRYNGRLAFGNNGMMTILDLHTMNYTTQSPVSAMSNPDWSPINGRELILGQFDVYLLDANSWQVTRIDEGGYPSWSPDGTQVVYTRRGTDPGLYIYDTYTGTRRYLPIERRKQAGPSYPIWSPDGERIAFSMQNSDGHADIFSVPMSCSDSQGCPLTQLTDSPGESSDYSPSWSPDGSRIAFVSTRSGDGAIYTMAANGADIRQLTVSPISSEIWDESPAFSPDGEYIAFDRQDDTVPGPRGRNIYIMRNDGSELTCLSSMPGRQPDWTNLSASEAIANAN